MPVTVLAGLSPTPASGSCARDSKASQAHLVVTGERLREQNDRLPLARIGLVGWGQRQGFEIVV